MKHTNMGKRYRQWTSTPSSAHYIIWREYYNKYHYLTTIEDAIPGPADFDVDDFLATTSRMYGSKFQAVELICDNSVIDTIIDRFGTDVTIYACDMSTFRVIVRVAISHIFFSWIFGFGGKVRIKGPEETKRQYAAMIRDTAAELE